MNKWFYWLIPVFFIFIISVLPYMPIPLNYNDSVADFVLKLNNTFVIIFPFIFLFGIFVSAIIIVFFKKKRQLGVTFLFLMFVLLVTCLVNSFFIVPKSSDFSKGYVIKKSNELIHSLEKYQLANGSYPEDLRLLVPDYINAIQKPRIIAVRNMTYDKILDNEYHIYFIQHINSKTFEIVFYNSNNNHETVINLFNYNDTNLKLKMFGKWRYFVYY